MKIKINGWLEKPMEKLLKDGIVEVDGTTSREMARAFKSLHPNNPLRIYHSRDLRQSLLILGNGHKKKRKKKIGFNTFMFEL